MRRGSAILAFGSLASIAFALLAGLLQQGLGRGEELSILWGMVSAFLIGGSVTFYLFWRATTAWRRRPSLVRELQEIVDDLAAWDDSDFAMFENAMKMMDAVPSVATFSVTRGSREQLACDKMRAAGLMQVPFWWASSRKPGDDGVVYELHPPDQGVFEAVVVEGYAASLKRRGIVLQPKAAPAGPAPA